MGWLAYDRSRGSEGGWAVSVSLVQDNLAYRRMVKEQARGEKEVGLRCLLVPASGAPWDLTLTSRVLLSWSSWPT